MASRLKDFLVGLISFMLATCTIYLTSDGRDIAAVWPANAVLLAALLDRRPGTETGVFVAGFLANLAANAVMRFMQDAETNADARAIIRAVAGLGTSLGITTLVEGVETEQQLDLARAEGVVQVQGYFFSRPQPETIISSELSR